MKHRQDSYQGFNLIELVIVIAVVSILASIAIPSYFNYTKRTYYGEIIQTLAPYKEAIVACYEKTKKLKECDGGKHKIPANITQPTKTLTSLKVINGVITVTPVKYDGITPEDIYIITPTITNKTITWMPSGPAVSKGYIE